MRDAMRCSRTAAAVGVVVALALLAAPRVRAQQNDPTPQWMRDSFSVSNRYLFLWEYFQSDRVTKFDIWNQTGDPETQEDDFTGFIEDARPDVFMYVRPWADSRLL